MITLNVLSQYLLIEVGFPIKRGLAMDAAQESQYLLIEVGFPMAVFSGNTTDYYGRNTF